MRCMLTPSRSVAGVKARASHSIVTICVLAATCRRLRGLSFAELRKRATRLESSGDLIVDRTDSELFDARSVLSQQIFLRALHSRYHEETLCDWRWNPLSGQYTQPRLARYSAWCGLLSMPLLRRLEVRARPPHDYRFNAHAAGPWQQQLGWHNQGSVNGKMRAILIDWLAEVCVEWRMLPQVLFVATRLVDALLAARRVERTDFQGYGIVALRVACEHEDRARFVPSLASCADIADNSWPVSRLEEMERDVHAAVSCVDLAPTTALVFLSRYLHALIVDVRRCRRRRLRPTSPHPTNPPHPTTHATLPTHHTPPHPPAAIHDDRLSAANRVSRTTRGG